jgi:hypothetical protein
VNVPVYADRDGGFRCAQCNLELPGPTPAHDCADAHPVRDLYANFPRDLYRHDHDAQIDLLRRWCGANGVAIGSCIYCHKSLQVTESTPVNSLILCRDDRQRWNERWMERLKRAISVAPDESICEAIAARAARKREPNYAH